MDVCFASGEYAARLFSVEAVFMCRLHQIRTTHANSMMTAVGQHLSMRILRGIPLASGENVGLNLALHSKRWQLLSQSCQSTDWIWRLSKSDRVKNDSGVYNTHQQHACRQLITFFPEIMTSHLPHVTWACWFRSALCPSSCWKNENTTAENGENVWTPPPPYQSQGFYFITITTPNSTGKVKFSSYFIWAASFSRLLSLYQQASLQGPTRPKTLTKDLCLR